MAKTRKRRQLGDPQRGHLNAVEGHLRDFHAATADAIRVVEAGNCPGAFVTILRGELVRGRVESHMDALAYDKRQKVGINDRYHMYQSDLAYAERMFRERCKIEKV